ncbi:MAG: DHH family phosphoesterase [Candidatus Aenigmatarchaeota archaeon]
MKLLPRLENKERILILTHHNADIDAVGSAIGLYEMTGKDVDLAATESISKGAKDLAEGYPFQINPELGNYELIIVLDCSSKEQIEPLDIEDSSAEIIVIDHHSPGNLEDIADESWIEPDFKSTAEMIYQIGEDEFEIKERVATGLICGMVADTSHLKLAEPKHFRYISKLLELSEKSYSDILSVLYHPPDFSERIARVKAASRIRGYRFGKKIVVFSSIGSFEAASARAFLRLGADIAIVFCPRKDQLRISARCRRNLVDEIHLADDLFSPLENKFAGSAGGHDAAASANLKDADKEDVFSKIIDRLEEILGENHRKL